MKKIKKSNKFEKLKIVGMGNEVYPGGRIDSFKISLLSKESPHHSHLIPLLLDLGFSKKRVLNTMDVILYTIDYMFVYGNPKIKAHISLDGKDLIIRFDTSYSRKKIISAMDKYFVFEE